MARASQLGIALGALGMILALMGLFPGVTGIQPVFGIGITQIVAILFGLNLMIIGGLIYVKFTFYSDRPANLAQQISVRLALTGMVFAAIAGMADVVGFGSHAPTPGVDILLGPLQSVGLIGSFVISSIGVLLYALTGYLGRPGGASGEEPQQD